MLGGLAQRRSFCRNRTGVAARAVISATWCTKAADGRTGLWASACRREEASTPPPCLLYDSAPATLYTPRPRPPPRRARPRRPRAAAGASSSAAGDGAAQRVHAGVQGLVRVGLEPAHFCPSPRRRPRPSSAARPLPRPPRPLPLPPRPRPPPRPLAALLLLLLLAFLLLLLLLALLLLAAALVHDDGDGLLAGALAALLLLGGACVCVRIGRCVSRANQLVSARCSAPTRRVS